LILREIAILTVLRSQQVQPVFRQIVALRVPWAVSITKNWDGVSDCRPNLAGWFPLMPPAKVAHCSKSHHTHSLRISEMPSLRIATWNTKQGVAPRQRTPALWEWISRITEAQLLVLTEARIPKEGVPDGWQLVYTPGGIGDNRKYGTVIAARDGVKIQRAEYKRSDSSLVHPHPATTFAVEVFIDSQIEFAVMGAYGLLHDTMNGFAEFEGIVNAYIDLVDEYGTERLVVAGDFNLWPDHLLEYTEKLALVDVTSQRRTFPKLREPVGGSRIWTHKNGAEHTDGARQELDYIFVSEDLKAGLRDIQGGVDDFPDSWEMSDHAPVAVTMTF
jgi:exonuclease III